jgi:hypothetical protein
VAHSAGDIATGERAADDRQAEVFEWPGRSHFPEGTAFMKQLHLRTMPQPAREARRNSRDLSA